MNYRDGFRDGVEEAINAMRLLAKNRTALAEDLYEKGSIGPEECAALLAESKMIEAVASFIKETNRAFFNDEQSGAV